MRYILVIGLLLFVFGCRTVSVVDDAKGTDSVWIGNVTCKRPYKLTQDCKGWSRANRKIKLNEFKIKISGSEDGKVIFIMDSYRGINTLLESISPLIDLADPTAEGTNNAFVAIKTELKKNNVEIEKVVPVTNLGSIDGYFLILNSNGYEILSQYTIQ